MALAPSDFLLGVPSSSIIRRSNASCSAASIPRRRGAILLRTFSTAVRTPLPPYRALSPSRSSWASCSPVEAPEGTAARPTLPEDTVTSHSSVGLPRLSRISRAWTSTISVMAVLQPGSARVARASSRSKAARRQACDPTFAGGRSHPTGGIAMNIRYGVVAGGLLLCLAGDAFADRDRTFILATGRRDPRMYAIDIQKALRPENNNTPNAIVSRSKTALDRLDGRPLGDPANVVISEDRKTAFIVNHHGAVDNAEFLQHGGRGGIAVMNVKKMIDRKNDNTAAALERHIDTGHFGAVGLALLPDMFIVGNAESHLTKDGGNRITFVDRRTGSLRGEVELALASEDCEIARHFPVKFVSPNGPPSPVALLSPDATWGCFPDTNGIAIGHGSDGKSYLFTANGRTDDVSVIDLERALAGDRLAEIHRIPTQIGPWGIAASPDAQGRRQRRGSAGARRRGRR